MSLLRALRDWLSPDEPEFVDGETDERDQIRAEIQSAVSGAREVEARAVEARAKLDLKQRGWYPPQDHS